MEGKEFKSSVIKNIDTLLNEIGFTSSKYHIYSKEIGKEVIGWIGLNISDNYKGAYVGINPVIGVRHQYLEKLLADLCEKKYDKISPPTISSPIGYLTPKNSFQLFEFTMDKPQIARETAKELINSVKEYGVKFMNENIQINNLCQNLNEKKFYFPQQSECRIAVCYYLLKEYDKTKTYINELLEKEKKKEIILPDYFGTFSKNILTLIEKKEK